MIQAWRYRHGGEQGEPVATDTLGSALERSRADGCSLLLIDVDAPTPADLDALAAAIPLHPLTLDDLRNANQRTKLEQFGDHWHVAVHVLAPVEERLQVQEVDIVFSRDWLVTVRQATPDGPPIPLEPWLHRFELARTQTGDDLGTMLWSVLDTIVDGYFVVAEWVDDRLDAIEDVVFDGGARDAIPKDIFEVRRDLVRFRRSALPVREVAHALSRREVPWMGTESMARMNDVWDHAMRIADTLDSQRDLLTALLEGHLAIVSNRMNDVMKKMSSWGALILVPSLIAGIYGMNFHHMLLQEMSFGYPAVLVLMGTVTFGLYAFFRRRQWL